ncbi:MAG: biotin carboxyl carrier protein [Moorellales bacterium]
MAEVKFVDTTVRDGDQSLWGATGLNTAAILEVAPIMDTVGFKAIDLTASIHMGVAVRYHKENPWERMRLVADRVRRTPLSFGTTGRRFIGFKRVPYSIIELVLKRVVANGIRRVWILDAAHEVPHILKVARLARAAGVEEIVPVFCYTISPVHTDRYYADRALELAQSPDVDALCLEDQGGLLIPERVRTLVPALKEALGAKPLELHFHCNTGMATVCYLEGIRCGAEVVHTTVPPLAYGTSLPSAENLLDNLPYLGQGAILGGDIVRALPPWLAGRERFWGELDREGLKVMSEHFWAVARRDNRPAGQPAEHDAYYYVHQVPGGMMSTLRRQLSEMKMLDRLPAVLEEVVRVREELGYPVMATPYSQFVGTQATMNVIYGERYKVIPTDLVQYAAGWFGPSPAPIDPNVMDRIATQPLAKEILGRSFPQPTVQELRAELGLGPEVSEEEFLLRYSLTAKEVDRMLAAGPIRG